MEDRDKDLCSFYNRERFFSREILDHLEIKNSKQKVLLLFISFLFYRKVGTFFNTFATLMAKHKQSWKHLEKTNLQI